MQRYSTVDYMKLVIKINGKLMWNRLHSRRLLLNSTWLSYHFIENHVRAEHVAKRKVSKYMVYQ